MSAIVLATLNARYIHTSLGLRYLAANMGELEQDTEIMGLSLRNLMYMRAFAEAWSEAEFVQQAAARLPWGHNLALLDRLNTRQKRG